jgi:hypothetical protein
VKLLSINNDAKTIKGRKLGYLTGVQYLAPTTEAGVGDLCPFSTPGCATACLFTAGRGAFNNVRESRIARTKLFMLDRASYWPQLIDETAALVRKAERESLTPAVRLNGTSDIKWEGLRYKGRTIFEHFPDVQFYDYTKWPASKRPADALPANYHLTFSRSELTTDADIDENIADGRNVAVVFSTRKGQPLPESYLGHRVIDGDESDVRFGDSVGVIVGLRSKGKAKLDDTGFVVNMEVA